MHGNLTISDVRKFAISEERKVADFSPRIAPSSKFSLPCFAGKPRNPYKPLSCLFMYCQPFITAGGGQILPEAIKMAEETK